jgi:hypothetical protein
MRLFVAIRILSNLRGGGGGVDVGRKDVHALKNSATIGRWYARALTRRDQGPLWLAIIWKLIVTMIAIGICCIVALGAAGITYAVIWVSFT